MNLLTFMNMQGVSERLQKELGLFQLVKSASTIFDLIDAQEKFLEAAIAKDEDDADLEAGAISTLTQDKKQVQAAGDRVFVRSLQLVESAIEKIQGSQIYMIDTSERARELKVQQRRVSAFKIVEKLIDLRDKLEKKRANLKQRAQKIVLSPTFQEFRSRSRSAKSRSRSAKSRSRSAKSRSRSAKSRSRSRSVDAPGRWTHVGSDEVLETVSPSAKAAIEQRIPLFALRARLGYNF